MSASLPTSRLSRIMVQSHQPLPVVLNPFADPDMEAATSAHAGTPLDTSVRRETTTDTLCALMNHPAGKPKFSTPAVDRQPALWRGHPQAYHVVLDNLNSDHAL